MTCTHEKKSIFSTVFECIKIYLQSNPNFAKTNNTTNYVAKLTFLPSDFEQMFSALSALALSEVDWQ